MAAPAVLQTSREHELETLFELGRGGMGTAYLARALGAGGFERLVVIKRLGLEVSGMEGALERFVAEARVAARLHHVNIVGTHQIDRDAVGPYIVLDYIEGGSLDELIEAAELRGERLPVPVVLRIAEDALAGLQAVHEATDPVGRPLRILHRDVSIQNVLVGVRDGVARLSDFGVAKSALSVTQTNPGSVVGKVLYLPPEYLRGDPVGPTFDIYALGITLWMSLTGVEPWPDLDDMELARAIAFDGVPSLEGLVDVAPEVRALVERACERDPNKRFQSAREMAIAIERWERQCGWVATHAEVAACVERLLGDKLRARREEVARHVAAPPEARRPSLHRLPRPQAVKTRAVPKSHTVELRVPPAALPPSDLEEVLPARRPRWRVPLAIGAAVGILTPAAWAFLRYGPVRPVASPIPAIVAPIAPALLPSIPSPPLRPATSSTASLTNVALPAPTTGSLASVTLQPHGAMALGEPTATVSAEPTVTVLGEPEDSATEEPSDGSTTAEPLTTASPDPLGLKRLAPPGPMRLPREPASAPATTSTPIRARNPYR
ncbi:MAG TPA: protein kinase [Polyangiaceae bacterium]|nr:protein kinase [Polyangiaceae bacterium]